MVKKERHAKRTGTKLINESILATEKTLERKSTKTKRRIGKSKGVLLMLTFSEITDLIAYKINNISVVKIKSACLGKMKKSVVRFVKRMGNAIKRSPKITIDAFSK